MPTFIPGYLVEFTLDSGDEISLSAESVAVAYGSATLSKPTFGARAAQAIHGQASGTFTASGHGSVEALAPLLGTIRAQTLEAAVVVTYGSGGSDAFAAIIGEVTTDAAADGQLSWTLNATISGEVTFTPPAP